MRYLEKDIVKLADPTALGPSATSDQVKAYKEALVEQDEWATHQCIIKQQVYSSIYESLLLKIQNFETGKEIWDALKKEQEEKSN